MPTDVSPKDKLKNAYKLPTVFKKMHQEMHGDH